MSVLTRPERSTLSHLLAQIQKPARYLGTEFHAVFKDPEDVDLRAVLLFPDLYEIGMSHLGLEILYHILNREDSIWAERAYTPALDLEELLRRQGLPLTSLESGTPLKDFHLVGISLQYELSYTNVLTMLELGGITWLAAARAPQEPVVIAGGPICGNPEPVAPFFDAILVGDGEEAIVEIAAVVRQWRQDRGSRPELWRALEAVEGVYVPAFFQPVYDAAGRLQEMRALGRRQQIRRRLIPDLDQAYRPPRPLVPQVQIVHDRLNVEIARGCTRGCRFCQAGMIYRPVRERRCQEVIAWTEAALAASGFEEVSLLSLSSGDYSCLAPLLGALMDRCAPQRIALSLPSMRADTLNAELMEQIKRVRKTGFTIAPEAGSEALRRAINKNLSEAEILATVARAFQAGWQLLKLYFMIGFPMETEADLTAMADLCRRALAVARGISAKAHLHVSINTFIPKPHTPFQWERQLSRAESQARLHHCKELLRQKHLDLKWNPSGQSWLEGILSRGDRRLAPVLMTAHRLGCRFDAWTEHCRLHLWEKALAEHGLRGEDYLRERREEEILPWAHLDMGVSRAFLLEERRRAWAGIQTPDCRQVGCLDCGVCDWQMIQPRLQPECPATSPAPPAAGAAPGAVYRYRLHYAKVAQARWLSHLEFTQVFYRSLRRAGLPVHFSQGFHPLPRVSFHGALPVGVASRHETLDLELSAALNPEVILARLNQVLPPGLEILAVAAVGPREEPPLELCQHYQVTSPSPILLQERAAAFLASEEFLFLRRRPKGTREIDIRPLVRDLQWHNSCRVDLVIRRRDRDNIKISELLAALFQLTEPEARQLDILKIPCSCPAEPAGAAKKSSVWPTN
jgi:radical SAM family uncharacterized protein/radical SAM-linked protein